MSETSRADERDAGMSSAPKVCCKDVLDGLIVDGLYRGKAGFTICRDLKIA